MAIKLGNRLKLLIKFTCWILSTSGLVWQVQKVSDIYFKYETQVDINVELKSTISMPGLTICLKIETNHTYLKSIYPQSIRLINGWSKKMNLNHSIYRYIPINILSRLPTQSIKIICKSPFPELTPIPINQLNSSKLEMCEDYTSIVTTIQFNPNDDEFYRCSTYFYSSYLPSIYQVNTLDDKDFFKLTIYSTGISKSNPSKVILFPHNPMEILYAPEADSFHFYVEQKDKIILTTTKLITNLLPYPYHTECINYSGIVYGRTGCIFTCRQDRVQNECPGIQSWTVPANANSNMTFSSHKQPCHLKQRHLCFMKDKCPAQCLNYWYTTSLIVNQEKRLPSNKTELYIRRPSGAEITYTHVPRMQGIEFLCYIASCFGMWLGISILDSFKLMSELFDKWIIHREEKIFVLNQINLSNSNQFKARVPYGAYQNQCSIALNP